MRPDLPGPEFNTSVLSDHDLLHGGLADVVIENLAQARRWARLVELGDRQARHELNVALFLDQHLPGIWELVRVGALDRRRVLTIVDILRHRLDDPAAWRRCGQRVLAYLRKHLRRDEELGVEVVACTVTQLRNKLNYETRRLRPTEDFAAAHAERGVRTAEFDDGTGQLQVTGPVDDAKLARHRLQLAAKERRAAGDARTIEQLMSDLAFDLIIGRAEGLPVPAYARPIINVTVPLETLAGIRDDPGLLSGGTVIPADLARAIAMKEGATWYRMLTDPASDLVTLSTGSYQPTAPIWRYVVADRPTCSHPACDRPSVECELDHEVEWPLGATDTDNLQPLCKLHHKAKHARAERPDLDWEYDAA